MSTAVTPVPASEPVTTPAAVPVDPPTSSIPRPAPASTPMPAPAPMRASDAEREEAVRRIHDALGEGRLNHEEAEERSAAAAEAKDRADLTPLLADLPPSSPAGRFGSDEVPSWISVREALVWRAHRLVWGPQAGRPSERECRTATLLAVAGIVLFLLCAVLGALAVGP